MDELRTKNLRESRVAELPTLPASAHESNDPIAAEDRQRMGQWLSQFLR
jgi:hypothetical protein